MRPQYSGVRPKRPARNSLRRSRWKEIERDEIIITLLLAGRPEMLTARERARYESDREDFDENVALRAAWSGTGPPHYCRICRKWHHRDEGGQA
jgi:hypothetical protein